MDPSLCDRGREHDPGVPRNLVYLGHPVRRLEWVSEVVVRLPLLQPLVAVVLLGDLPDQSHNPGVIECHQAWRDVFLLRCIHFVQCSLDPDRSLE